MGEYLKSEEAILLFDSYSLDSQRLHNSFKRAGCGHIAVVIEDNGFLPEDVMSVYGFFLGDYKWKNGYARERRLQLNEIITPDWPQIEINEEYHCFKEKGKVFYVGSLQKRRVKTVNWYGERNEVCFSDHYNRYGAMYARTVFNAGGQKAQKIWYSPEGRGIIEENFIHGSITLNEDKDKKVFQKKMELVVYFFIKTGFWQKSIFFNSLSTPFFVSNRLKASGKKDLLFWQEPVNGEIPGNMRFILEGKSNRTKEIVVQKRYSYDRLLELGANAAQIHRLGFIYRFQKENEHKPEALICTNSENVEHCRELAEALPQMQFHIAALTAMSQKLMAVGELENVSLYPGIEKNVLEGLFQKCDYYLDINYGMEIVSSIYRAFLHNQMILAFDETVHDRNYVAEKWIYPAKDWGRMVEDIRGMLMNKELLERCIERQHEEAWAEDREAYIRMLEVGDKDFDIV